MFVLGIDPGLSHCGYGLVARAEGAAALRAHAAGVIETDPGAPLAERLLILHTELRALVASCGRRRSWWSGSSSKSMPRRPCRSGQASGLALLVAAEGGCEIGQYTANEVKLCLVGYGAATKEQVQRMVAQVLGLPAVEGPARRGRCAGSGGLPPDHRAAAPGHGAGGSAPSPRLVRTPPP